MDLRKALLKPGNQVEEILKRQVGMQSADDVKLRDRLGITGSGSLESFFQRHGVGARACPSCVRRHTAAGGHANIGRIQMAVDVEVRLVAVHAFANVVGHPADGQNVAGAIKSESVIGVQPLASNNLGVNWARAARRRSEMNAPWTSL